MLQLEEVHWLLMDWTIQLMAIEEVLSAPSLKASGGSPLADNGLDHSADGNRGGPLVDNELDHSANGN